MAVSDRCPGARNPACTISGQSGVLGSFPPTTSCGRESLFTNATRCPTLVVISRGVMPVELIVMVGVAGGPDGADGGVPATGIAVGAAGDFPELHAVPAMALMKKQRTKRTMRSMAAMPAALPVSYRYAITTGAAW